MTEQRKLGAVLENRILKITFLGRNGPETIEVTEFELKQGCFRDKSVAIYGGSGSGKSTTIKCILSYAHADYCAAFAYVPTNDVNKDYDGLISDLTIYKQLQTNHLQSVMKYAAARTAIYGVANDPAIISRVFSKLTNPDTDHNILAMYEKSKEALASPAVRGNPSQESEVRKVLREAVTNYMKGYITRNRDKLRTILTDQSEKTCAEMHDINPYTLILMDDCSSEIKMLCETGKSIAKQATKKTGEIDTEAQVMENLTQRGRWAHITFMLAAHGVAVIAKEARDNIMNSIFCSPGMALHYVSLCIENADQRFTGALVDAVYNADIMGTKHAKLLYNKLEDKWHYVVPHEVHNIIDVGAPSVKLFLSKIPRAPKDTLDHKNAFISDYKNVTN